MTLEQAYPTKRARDAADKAIDDVSDETSIGDACAIWARVYEENGGVVAKRKKGEGR